MHLLNASVGGTSISVACLRSRGRLAVASSSSTGSWVTASRSVSVASALISITTTLVARATGASTGRVAVTILAATFAATSAVAVSAIALIAVAAFIASVIVTAAITATSVIVATFVTVAAVIVTATTAAAASAATTVTASTLFVSSLVVAFVATVAVGIIAAVAAAAAVTATTAVFVTSTSGARLSLGRSKVLAGCRGTRTGSACLLDAQGTALNLLALQALLSGLGLIGCDHLDKAKSTRLLCVGVAHDLAFFNVAILLEHLGDLSFGQLGVDAGNEKVGARVDSTVVVVTRSRYVLHVAVAMTTGRGGATAATLIVVTRSRRGASVVALVSRSLIFVSVAIGSLVIHRSGSHVV